MKSICFLLLLVTSAFAGRAQCDEVPRDNFYQRVEPMHSNGYLNQLKSLAPSGDSLLMAVDTTYFPYSDSTLLVGNKTFLVYDSIGKKHRHKLFARDLKTGLSYYLVDDWYQNIYSYLIVQTDKFIILRDNGNPAIFYFDKKIKATTPIDFDVEAGRTDSSFFVAAREPFVFNKQNYPKGTIVEITGNGFRIAYQPDCPEENELIYYNGNYKLENHFMEHVEKNCSSYNIYISRIYLGKTAIDSFIYTEYRYGTRLSAFTQQDTFSVYYGDDYRRYIAGRKDLHVSLDSLFMKRYAGQRFERWYRITGDYIIYELYRDAIDSSGYISVNNKLLTLNRETVDPTKEHYNVFAVFNMRTQKFLGFPALVLTASK